MLNTKFPQTPVTQIKTFTRRQAYKIIARKSYITVKST